MFSQTIYISHGTHASGEGGVGGGGGQAISNGHEFHQNGSSEVLYKESYGSNSDKVRSFYKSRVIEKLYSDGARATREESREVSCFVRSEIKWVFLKSLKVRQSVLMSCCHFFVFQTQLKKPKTCGQSSLDIKAPKVHNYGRA